MKYNSFEEMPVWQKAMELAIKIFKLTEKLPRKEDYGLTFTPTLLVAQLGARMHYAVPEIFYRAGMLGKFYTDVYAGDKAWLERMLKPISGRFSGIAKLLSRKSNVIPPEKVVSFDALGIWYWWRQKKAKNTRELSEVFAKGKCRRYREQSQKRYFGTGQFRDQNRPLP